MIFLSPVNSCNENGWGWKDGGIGDDECRDLRGCMVAEQRLRKVVAQCADRQGYSKGHTGFLQEVEFFHQTCTYMTSSIYSSLQWRRLFV